MPAKTGQGLLREHQRQGLREGESIVSQETGAAKRAAWSPCVGPLSVIVEAAMVRRRAIVALALALALTLTLTLTLTLALTLLAACGRGSRASAPPAPVPPVPTSAGADPAAATTPAPAERSVPLLASKGARIPAEPAGAAAPSAPGAPAIAFDLPGAWKAERPSSSMRFAQATIPGPGGPGQFAAFFFGVGGGGLVDDNIKRWVGQLETSQPPSRTSFTANGLQVTWVDVAGTMKPSSMGLGPATAQPGWRLLGAVVEGPGGPWFFKAIGPNATLARARESFLEMLHGLRAR
jgi:hypothetical protein